MVHRGWWTGNGIARDWLLRSREAAWRLQVGLGSRDGGGEEGAEGESGEEEDKEDDDKEKEGKGGNEKEEDDAGLDPDADPDAAARRLEPPSQTREGTDGIACDDGHGDHDGNCHDDCEGGDDHEEWEIVGAHVSRRHLFLYSGHARLTPFEIGTEHQRQTGARTGKGALGDAAASTTRKDVAGESLEQDAGNRDRAVRQHSEDTASATVAQQHGICRPNQIDRCDWCHSGQTYRWPDYDSRAIGWRCQGRETDRMGRRGESSG